MNDCDYILITDASVRKLGDSSDNHAAYAVIVLNPTTNKYVLFTEYLGKKSILYSEGCAIVRGLDFIKKKKKKKNVSVVVFTDSQITVDIMTHHIFKWDKTIPKRWRNKSGKLVKNQKLYAKMYSYLTNKCYDVKACHIPAHMRVKDGKAVQKYLTDTANINLTEKTAKCLIQLNNLADHYARQMTKNPLNMQVVGQEKSV